MSEKKVRFGILGASRIALKSAIPAIEASGVAELTLIGSREPERARELPFAVGTYEDVLAADIDAIYIPLPNSMHEEWCVKALEAGKHVWCEKPAALGYESAKKMVDAAKQAQKRLMEGFMFLRHPQHAQVLDLIARGEIGGVLGFVGAFTFPMEDRTNFRLNKQMGGGVYFDAAVYPIRASRMIFAEEPESVKATLSIDPEIGVDTRASVELTYSGGRTALALAAFEETYRSTYTVVGTSREIEMERAYSVPADREVHVYVRAGGETHTIAVPPTDQFRLMVEEFCEEIRSELPTKNYEEDLLAQARIIEAGKISAAEDRTVMLSEIV